MSLVEAYMVLGSNLGDREANIRGALRALRGISAELTASAMYETTPQGFRSQPAFLNAACLILTRLGPFELLARTREIEARAGRRCAFVNGPRSLDIDLVVYGRTVLRAPHLQLPHPKMAVRSFVLVPLAEIAPGLVHPVLGQTVRSLAGRLPAPLGVRRWMPPRPRGAQPPSPSGLGAEGWVWCPRWGRSHRRTHT